MTHVPTHHPLAHRPATCRVCGLPVVWQDKSPCPGTPAVRVPSAADLAVTQKADMVRVDPPKEPHDA